MASGVPHGSTVKPVLLKALIQHLDAGVKCTLSKFADDTKLRGAIGSPKESEGFMGRSWWNEKTWQSMRTWSLSQNHISSYSM